MCSLFFLLVFRSCFLSYYYHEICVLVFNLLSFYMFTYSSILFATSGSSKEFRNCSLFLNGRCAKILIARFRPTPGMASNVSLVALFMSSGNGTAVTDL